MFFRSRCKKHETHWSTLPLSMLDKLDFFLLGGIIPQLGKYWTVHPHGFRPFGRGPTTSDLNTITIVINHLTSTGMILQVLPVGHLCPLGTRKKGYLADWNRIHGKYDIAPWNGYFPKWEILLKDMALSAKNVKDENSSKERSGCYLAASFREAEGKYFFNLKMLEDKTREEFSR